MQDPIDQVGRTADLIDKGPLQFLCASLFLAVLVLFGLLMKALRDRVTERNLLQKEWDKARAEMEKEHAQEKEKLYRESRDASVRTEVALHRVLELLPVIRSLRKSYTRKTNPGIQLPEPEEEDDG